MHLATYVGLLETGSETLAASYRQVAEGHAAEADVHHLCLQLSAQCDEHRRKVGKIAERYGDHPDGEPERLHAEGLSETRSGGSACCATCTTSTCSRRTSTWPG